MSLQLWLPLTKDLRQQGVSNVTVTNNGATFNSAGKLGGCYVFDGTNDAISIGNLSALVETNFSFTCWFYHSNTWSTKSYETILGGPSGFELEAKNGSTNSPVIKAYSWGGGSFTYELNKWNHLVMTRTSSETKFYLNGELKLTGTAGSIPSGDYFVGAWKTSTSQNYKGSICDVRIYDHCLSPMEVKQLSQGLVLHYPLNRMGFGQENFILEGHKVTSGGNANGITRTYESDGSMKIVSTSGNGNYASLGFAQNSNTSVGNNMVVGDTYCISCDVKIETGTALPTLFINSGNGYKQLKPVNGSIITGKWIRVYYTSTWAEPGTQYGNISLHLGFSGAIGTYYFKNFKLEKGSTPTPWCPNSADALATTMGLNSTTEYDCSGFCNNGTRTGTFSWMSDAPKYSVSTQFNSTSTKIQLPVMDFSGMANSYTFAWWQYNVSTGNMPWGFSNGNRLNCYHCSPLCWNTGDGSSNQFKNGSATVAPTTIQNGWHHIVVTGDGTATKLYIDGVYKGTATTYKPLTGTQIWISGWDSGTSYTFNGSKECDFRIYATALSAEDVKQLYNSNRL